MAEGYEVRQVIQDQDVSGRANQPARQIAGVGVQSPRGGDMSQVGREQRVLAEALQMGGEALAGYAKKADEDQRLLGHMDYMEGKTEAQLKASGYTTSRIQGFRALKAKTAANEWFASQTAAIEGDWMDKPPEEFKKHLMENWRELSDGIDPNDTETRKLIGGFAGDMFGRLVQQHTLTHAAWAEKEAQGSYSALLTSESKTGDTDSLKEIAHGVDALLPNQSPDNRRAAQLRSVRETLTEGNFNVYNTFGGLDGIRKMGATEEEINSVQHALKKGQTENESRYMGEINEDENRILLDLKETGDDKTAMKELKALQERYNTSPEFVRTVANRIQTESFSRQLTERETATLTNPEYLDDLEKVVHDTKWGALDNDKSMKAVDALAEKHKLSPEIARAAYTKTLDARNSFVASQDAKLREQAREIADNIKMDVKATALRGSGFVDAAAYDSKVQRRAFQQEKMAIAQAVRNDPTFANKTEEEQQYEIISRHVNFLRNVPVRDEQLKNDFATALQGPPVDEQGKVRPDAIQAFEYMSAMRNAGLSERTIKDYIGDSYSYLSTAVEAGSASIDPVLALSSAYNMVETKMEGREPPNTKEMIIQYRDKREKYFDNLEPSMIAGWLGADSGSQYDQILSDQVKEAAKGSEDMDAWMNVRIKTFANMYPTMKSEAVIKLAMKDMSKWEYVMGRMVKPVGTKSLSEEMGIADLPGPLQSNAALLTFLHDKGDKLFPKGEERDWWTRIKDGAAGAGNTIFYQPEKIGELLRNATGGKDDSLDVFKAIGKVQNVLFAASEKEQRLANDIKMVDVQPLQNGQLLITLYQDTAHRRPIGMTRVPAKDIGTYYKAKREADKVEQHLIKRQNRR